MEDLSTIEADKRQARSDLVTLDDLSGTVPRPRSVRELASRQGELRVYSDLYGQSASEAVAEGGLGRVLRFLRRQ